MEFTELKKRSTCQHADSAGNRFNELSQGDPDREDELLLYHIKWNSNEETSPTR